VSAEQVVHNAAMFDLDAFIAELVGCVSETDPRRATEEAVARAITAPTAVADAIAPDTGGITLLHHSPELTVINVAWAPSMQVMPHDHRMWAVIGIYAGAEDNQFYRRGADGELAATTSRRLDVGDVCLLGSKTIHAVANPMDRLTAAIHVYGGDFLNEPRSQWGPGDLIEREYDMAEVNRQFHQANIAAGLAPTS
jgi:predicted metal-dependent enzyme (double-stranded beta helix superfamily)